MKPIVLIYVFTSILIVMRSDLFVDINSLYFVSDSKNAKERGNSCRNDWIRLKIRLLFHLCMVRFLGGWGTVNNKAICMIGRVHIGEVK